MLPVPAARLLGRQPPLQQIACCGIYAHTVRSGAHAHVRMRARSGETRKESTSEKARLLSLFFASRAARGMTHIIATVPYHHHSSRIFCADEHPHSSDKPTLYTRIYLRTTSFFTLALHDPRHHCSLTANSMQQLPCKCKNILTVSRLHT